jgi:hypothetical protein
VTTQKKRGHHFVPNNSYLKNFSDASGKVWVLDDQGKIYQTNPANLFKEAHFYTIKLRGGGGSLIIEDTLANIESVFARIYQDKISKGLELDETERAHVAVFLAALYLRTKSNREGIKGALSKLYGSLQQWKEMFENDPEARALSASLHHGDGGEGIGMDDVKGVLDDIDEFHSTTMMDALPEIAQMIYDMKWCIMTAPGGHTFISSEDPFQMLRPESVKKYGAKAMGSVPGLIYEDVEVTVPLSSTHAILAGWRLHGNLSIEVDGETAEHINVRTLMGAQTVVARDRAILEKIKMRYEQSAQ